MGTGREPIIEESVEDESEPQPSTESAGGARPPGRIGGGLQDGDSDNKQPPTDPPPNPELLGRWRDLPIEDLNLSMRGYNTLRRSGRVTLGSIVSTPPEDLLPLRNFGGVKSLDEVREKIAGVLELGLWKTYRDYGLIYDWLEAANDVVRRSDA